MNAFLLNWKSTVSGVLTATLATTAAFLSPPLNQLISAQHVLYIGAFQVIGKIWIGLITKDADKALAVVPGQPAPQVVAAHPVPDNPSAIPVVPASTATEVKP